MSKQLQGAVNQAETFKVKYGNLSGPGSLMKTTKEVRLFIPYLIMKYGIKTINDAPCGDHSWMQYIDLQGASYKGFDIVDFVLEEAKRNSPTRLFSKHDIVQEILPPADLIISRDFLFHIDNKSIVKVIENFKQSKARYLLSTTFDCPTNEDLRIKEIEYGYGWRKINLREEPFNLGEPIEIVKEMHPRNEGRSVGLWEIN